MAAQKGRDMLVEVETTTDVWVVIGGARQIRKRGGRSSIDVTTASSTDLNRVLLDGGGVYSESISISGVFEDDAGFAKAEELNISGALNKFRFTVPDLAVYVAQYQLTDLECDNGGHDGAVQYSATLESSGTITRTPAV